MLWHNDYGVTGSPDVIGDVTIWLPLATFPIIKNPTSPTVSEIFGLKLWLDDVITDVIRPLSTICVDLLDVWHRRPLWPFEAAYVTSYRSSIETKRVSRLVFEMFSFENFYVMTSLLTSRRRSTIRVDRLGARAIIVLKDGLIPTRNVGEEAFWKSWRHNYDVIGSRDITDDVTIRLPLATFL